MRSAGWIGAWLLAACHPEAPPPAPPPPPQVRPGDTLFDRLPDLLVESTPLTNLPVDVVELAGDLLPSRSWAVATTAWQPEAGREDAWFTVPRLPLDLALGAQWFEHEGRRLPALSGGAERHQRDAARGSAWSDREGGLEFHWDAGRGALVATGVRAPGPLSFGYVVDAGTALGLWERRVGRDPVPTSPATARELACRQAMRRVDRPAIMAPAPTTLTVDLPTLAVDTLRLSLAVLDAGLSVTDGRLQRRPGASDGVLFAVDVVEGGVTRRIWNRHIQVGRSWAEETVDLSAYTGRPVSLRLVTDPGPEGNAIGDYALWSGLRFSGLPQRRPPRPHVVIIDVDTLRADRLGCYGNPRDSSPAIDAWAAERAVLYSDCSAPSNWTLPSTVSMLTGLSSDQHQVHDYPQGLVPALEPVAARLRAVGYETLAETDGGFVGGSFGFQHGFDVFDGRLVRDDERLWQATLERLEGRHSERPVFVFLHTYMVHAPYADDRRFADADYDGPFATDPMGRAKFVQRLAAGLPPPSEADWAYVLDTYDAGIRRMDDEFARVLDLLETALYRLPTLVILTSDHGEEISERGLFGHGHSLHRELLHVPLIVQYPEGAPVGVVDTPTSGLDLVPTILDVVGLPIPGHLPGRSLRALGDEPRLILSDHTGVTGPARSIRFDGWKLLTGAIEGYGGPTRFPDLYRLEDDSRERRDLADHDPRTVERLQELADRHREQHPPLRHPGQGGAAAVSPEVVEHLQALGYLGGDG